MLKLNAYSVNLSKIICHSVKEKRGVSYKQYVVQAQKLKRSCYSYKIFKNEKFICEYCIDYLKKTLKYISLDKSEAEEIEAIDFILIMELDLVYFEEGV